MKLNVTNIYVKLKKVILNIKNLRVERTVKQQ